jgi:hypothetical protein
MNTTEKIAMMAEAGIIYEDVAPLWVQHGTTIKKELYFIPCIDKRTGQNISCMRTKIVDREIIYKDFAPDLVEMIGEKYSQNTAKEPDETAEY